MCCGRCYLFESLTNALSPTLSLELLTRVQLRIASADSDERLQELLANLLVPLLLKFSMDGTKVKTPEEHAQVRAKVIEVLGHINKV